MTIMTRRPGMIMAVVVILLLASLMLRSSGEKRYPPVADVDSWSIRSQPLGSNDVKTYNEGTALELLRENSATDLGKADIDKMSDLQVQLTLHTVLDNPEILCHRKLRMGNVGDGGWEVCDDPGVRPDKDCIVYSFGINWDFTFDDYVAKVYGCHVYAFDPSMGMKQHNRSAKVHFYPLGISDHDHVNHLDWQLYTFGRLRELMGHKNRKIDVLKMDVEFAEWTAIPEMIRSGQMKNIKQALLEFHVEEPSGSYYKKLLPGDTTSDEDAARQRLTSLQGLHQAGFRLFYPHKNVHCKKIIKEFPSERTNCYEVHYIQA